MPFKSLLLFIILSSFIPLTSYGQVKFYGNLNRRQINEQEAKQMVDDLALIQSIVKNFGGDLQGPCPGSEFAVNSKKRVWTMDSNENKKNITLTDLSMDEAVKVFEKVKKRVPLKVEDANAQAHMINILLEKDGIISGKVFIEGKLYTQTSLGEALLLNSTAAFVLVNRIPYVLDPAHFDGPVTYGEWKLKVMENSKSRFDNMYFTTRFVYNTSDKFKDDSQYRIQTLEDLNSANLQNCRLNARAQKQDPAIVCVSK